MISITCGTSATIDLHNPVFGDKRKHDHHLIVNKTINGYNTFAQNSETGAFISLSYSFETMDQYDEFLVFIRDVNGLQCHITTHDNIEYDGVIVGPFVFEIKRDGTYTEGQTAKKCTTNWGFTFEVEMILS
jgi:hypothetical protein